MGAYKMISNCKNESDFIRAFDEAGRADNFSVQARRELFMYYSELSDVDCDLELDVIAICCDWGEYSADELVQSFGDPRHLEASELAEELAEAGTLIRVEHIAQPDTYLYVE